MTDFIIPCAVFARLAKILRYKHPEMNDWFHSVRIDNGIALASNRRVLVGECIGGNFGVCHITSEPALIAQCEKEAPFDSVLSISVNETLRFASARTTMGYQFPGNACVFSVQENKMNDWRNVVARSAKPAGKSSGGLFLNSELIAILVDCSVSGRVIFEEKIDVTRPMIVRDVVDPNWFGCFVASSEEQFPYAKYPEFLK